MEAQLQKIIKKLEQVRIGVREAGAFCFKHDGDVLTPEMLATLKTQEDVIEFAKRLVDGLIPGTDEYNDVISRFAVDDLDEWMAEMEAEKEEQDEFHRLHTNPTPEEIEEGQDEHSSDEHGPETDWYTLYYEVCDEMGLSGDYKTINEFLTDVGYSPFQDDYPFDPQDFIDLWGEDQDEGFTGEEDFRLFMSGEMDQSIGSPFNSILSALLEICGDSRMDYKHSANADYEGFPTEEGENKFFVEEGEDENAVEEEVFRAMTVEAFETLKEYGIKPEESKWLEIKSGEDYVADMDFDQVQDFYDEVEQAIEVQEKEEEQRRDELLMKAGVIQGYRANEGIWTARDMDNDELEEWVEELEEKGQDYKSRKRPRDYFDEQDVKEGCDLNDPNHDIAEIRYEQGKTDLSFNPTAFKMLCKEVVQDFVNRDEYVFEPGFYEALQEASEAYLVGIFQDANIEALHAGRTHIQPRDIQIVRRVNGERP